MKLSGQAQVAFPFGVKRHKPLQPPLFSHGFGLTEKYKTMKLMNFWNTFKTGNRHYYQRSELCVSEKCKN